MAQAECEGNNAAWFVCFQSSLDDVRVGSQQESDIPSRWLSEQGGINLTRGGKGKEFRVLASEGRKSDMCVLEIGSRVTLERQHPLPVEGIVVDSGGK